MKKNFPKILYLVRTPLPLILFLKVAALQIALLRAVLVWRWLVLNSTQVRKTILEIAHRAKSPHIGSAFSCVDMFCAVYGQILSLPPYTDSEAFAKRDIFLLSKAHSAMSLYATLYHKGLMSKEQIEGYYQNHGTLPAHTDRFSSPYVEISAGSLGHGLPIGVGMALAIRGEKNPQGSARKVIVLMGDGEVQEGSVWEAAMFAPKYNLQNLIVLIDRNNLQGYGRGSELVSFEPLEDKWRAFGWECARVDGHNQEMIVQSIRAHTEGDSQKPLCVICDTIKGKGVSFMEDKLEWHYFLVSDEVYHNALKELQ